MIQSGVPCSSGSGLTTVYTVSSKAIISPCMLPWVCTYLSLNCQLSDPPVRCGASCITVYIELRVRVSYLQYFWYYIMIFWVNHRLASLSASLSLFKVALSAILRSPVSFFDTTPLGNFESPCLLFEYLTFAYCYR